MMTSKEEQSNQLCTLEDDTTSTTSLHTTKHTKINTTTKSASTISQQIKTLQQLNNKYTQLQSTEDQLTKYLHQLQQQQSSLQLALEQSSTSIKEQRDKESKLKDDEAVKRLEEALMMNDESADDSSDVCSI
jgi:predicted RNase H-like nuclease (RuvC/YqgF family)